jgi:transcriptional regulator with XRE-family HTH domain
METGRLIKELRIKKGVTQEELADKTLDRNESRNQLIFLY